MIPNSLQLFALTEVMMNLVCAFVFFAIEIECVTKLIFIHTILTSSNQLIKQACMQSLNLFLPSPFASIEM